MRASSLALLLVILATLPLAAQGDGGPRFELGLTARHAPRFESSGFEARERLSTLGLYFDVFASDAWVVSPSISNLVWGDGPRAARVRLDVRRLLRPEASRSPYLFGAGSAFLRRGDDFVDGRRDVALGGGGGVRWASPWGPALSVEVRYDRWLQDDGGQVGLGLRIGIPFGR